MMSSFTPEHCSIRWSCYGKGSSSILDCAVLERRTFWHMTLGGPVPSFVRLASRRISDVASSLMRTTLDIDDDVLCDPQGDCAGNGPFSGAHCF